MAKRKLQRFAAINSFTNVLQNADFLAPGLKNHEGEPIESKGNWHNSIFKNEHPITIELACGKGEYTVNMAREMPLQNHIAVDIKGNRMFIGASIAIEEQLTNVKFLRTDINLLPLFFARDEVSEIWITFPDPHLRPGKDQKRLTSKRFLNYYHQFLKPGGRIHLKTDDDTLYRFTLQTIAENNYTLHFADDDIYANPLHHPFLAFKTYYETMHLQIGRTIKYIQFSF